MNDGCHWIGWLGVAAWVAFQVEHCCFDIVHHIDSCDQLADLDHIALGRSHWDRHCESLSSSPEGQAGSTGTDLDVGVDFDPAIDRALDTEPAQGLAYDHCDHWGSRCTADSPDYTHLGFSLALAIVFAHSGGRVDTLAGQQLDLVAIVGGIEGRPWLSGEQYPTRVLRCALREE